VTDAGETTAGQPPFPALFHSVGFRNVLAL